MRRVGTSGSVRRAERTREGRKDCAQQRSGVHSELTMGTCITPNAEARQLFRQYQEFAGRLLTEEQIRVRIAPCIRTEAARRRACRSTTALCSSPILSSLVRGSTLGRRGESTNTVFVASWGESSPPLVQYVNPVANRNSRGLQLGDRGSNPAIRQIVTRVVVEPDDQYPGMMTNGRLDQVMQVFEVCRILSQNREGLGDRVNQHPRIRDRKQSGIPGQDRIVPLSPQSRSQTRGYSNLRRSGLSFRRWPE